jgi:hypothetical protein
VLPAVVRGHGDTSDAHAAVHAAVHGAQVLLQVAGKRLAAARRVEGEDVGRGLRAGDVQDAKKLRPREPPCGEVPVGCERRLVSSLSRGSANLESPHLRGETSRPRISSWQCPVRWKPGSRHVPRPGLRGVPGCGLGGRAVRGSCVYTAVVPGGRHGPYEGGGSPTAAVLWVDGVYAGPVAAQSSLEPPWRENAQTDGWTQHHGLYLIASANECAHSGDQLLVDRASQPPRPNT